jgi:general secretion pathway protein N
VIRVASPFPLFLVGLAAYALFLALGVPATVVGPRLEAASGGRLRVVSTSGTITAGRATLEVRTPALGTWRVDALRWAWRPARLFAGELAFDLEADLAGLRLAGRGARSLGEWQLRDLRGRGEAEGLGTLVPLAASWQPAGAVALEATSLAFDGKEVRGSATLDWRDASLSLSAARPLGSWRATLAGDGGPARVTLATVKGPLRLSGKGTIAPSGRLAFMGEARPEAGREAELEPVLSLIGPRRADGARTLEVR